MYPFSLIMTVAFYAINAINGWYMLLLFSFKPGIQKESYEHIPCHSCECIQLFFPAYIPVTIFMYNPCPGNIEIILILLCSIGLVTCYIHMHQKYVFLLSKCCIIFYHQFVVVHWCEVHRHKYWFIPVLPLLNDALRQNFCILWI